MVVMFTMECSNNKRRSTDPVQPSCPHFSSGAGCTSIPSTMSSTRCLFSVSQIISFFRFGHNKRRNKVMKGIGGNSTKSRRTADKISKITSKTKGGKVQKRTYEKKDQERVNCDPAKLGKQDSPCVIYYQYAPKCLRNFHGISFFALHRKGSSYHSFCTKKISMKRELHMFRTSASQSLSGIDHLIFLRLVDMNEQTRIVYSGTSYVEGLVPASAQKF